MIEIIKKEPNTLTAMFAKFGLSDFMLDQISEYINDHLDNNGKGNKLDFEYYLRLCGVNNDKVNQTIFLEGFEKEILYSLNEEDFPAFMLCVGLFAGMRNDIDKSALSTYIQPVQNKKKVDTAEPLSNLYV